MGKREGEDKRRGVAAMEGMQVELGSPRFSKSEGTKLSNGAMGVT